jgi:hypothetical protein
MAKYMYWTGRQDALGTSHWFKCILQASQWLEKKKPEPKRFDPKIKEKS